MLQHKKHPPDEMSIILLAKWQRKNITIVTSKEIWSLYPKCKPDLVLGYIGKDLNKANHLGRWVRTNHFRQTTSRRELIFQINNEIH